MKRFSDINQSVNTSSGVGSHGHAPHSLIDGNRENRRNIQKISENFLKNIHKICEK